ncbi:hypothetical protein ACOMHN_028055 [Nucella lapillus]
MCAGRWLFGIILCNLFVTADVLMCTSSILHLCTISLERYIGIRYPLWAKNKSKRTVFFKIVLVWTLALAITSPITVLGFVNDSNILQDGLCLLNNQHFIIYGSIFAFFIPLTIMVIMYALTVRMLNKQAKLCGGGGGGGGGNGGERQGGEGQPVIRRSTSSRRHWSRHHHRHTVLGAPGVGPFRRDPLTSTNSYPLGSGTRSAQRYQPLSKRNTLPLCHERESSFSAPSLQQSSDFAFCNGDGNNENGGEELLDHDAAYKSKWRQFKVKRSSQSSPPEEEPRRLKELVRKHHVAVKAANILLMRRDVFRKESNSVQTEQKASKVLGVVFMIFVICWAPFFLVNILTVLCADCYFSPTLFTVFVWLGYVSSTLNPIIYTVFNKIFKLTFLKLLCCRYGHLHRGRRRSHHTAPAVLCPATARGNSSGGTSSSQSGLLTCSSFCRNGGGSSNVHLEESIC